MDFLEKQKIEIEALKRGECGCWSCMEARGGTRVRFIVCEECGNKRCPKATDHTLACTGSNEPGQAGSRYD